MSETIYELNERLKGLIESLETADLESEVVRQFVETKYNTVSLHVFTESGELEQKLQTNSEQLEYRKQLNLYHKLQEILSAKCSDQSIVQMVDKLQKCKEVIAHNV